jgi:hypothetical protein
MTLTNAQRQCLERAKETLGEHFEASVIVVMVLSDHGREGHWIARSGGFATTRGLLDIATLKLDADWTESQQEHDDG